MDQPRRPTHVIRARDRQDPKNTNIVGNGWLNSDGSMSIVLRAGVSLSWDDGLQITAFVDDYQKGREHDR